MFKPNSGQEATGRDLQQISGDLDDSTVLAILTLHPTVAQLEEVRMRLDGEDDALGQRPLGGVVAEIQSPLARGSSMLQKRAASQSKQSV
jgi:hypothetical protein